MPEVGLRASIGIDRWDKPRIDNQSGRTGPGMSRRSIICIVHQEQLFIMPVGRNGPPRPAAPAHPDIPSTKTPRDERMRDRDVDRCCIHVVRPLDCDCYSACICSLISSCDCRRLQSSTTNDIPRGIKCIHSTQLRRSFHIIFYLGTGMHAHQNSS